MSSQHFPVYSLLLLLAAAVIIPLLNKKSFSKVKLFLITVLVAVWGFTLKTLLFVYQSGAYSYNFGNWNEIIGVQFIVDEFSALMTLFVMSLAILILIYSFKDMEHEINKDQFTGYYTLVFILLFSMIGITYTNDLFNMYVFMEILSITSCSIISIKKKKENYMAAFRYLILNTIGSLSILMGIAMIYMVTGHLNMTQVYQTIAEVWQLYPTNILTAVGFILTGLGIKAAMFPLHIWLPDAHSTAPSPSSALLSSLVVKVYIFSVYKILFKVLGQSIVVALGVPTFITYFAAVGMIMGSVFAIGQKDIKRMLAYSSVAQIGYIFLGLGLVTIDGLSASMFHIISHGLMKSALFLSAGAIIYYKDKRNINDLDGIGYEMPITMFVFTVAAFGMIGIPGINGFMSKIYLSFAVLDANKPIYLILILASSFLNAVYYLPIIISAFLKESKDRKNIMEIDKLPKSMLIPMVILALGSIIMGFYPQLIMNVVEKAVPTFLF
ncbi:proton-conducting transporter transmembrane domain-containing protein [Alkaliphilus peptidifermentans]|uniref:Multisubunit sodium/proton antiporter, MrpD subunit n=1 Tax=Alkaliphilus peptidifermentans DSM 18978 TaxID=1120976 RepID=A0A1G5GDM7_9FIRM|nr:proton-conducting transporter membrane subunit [Alkaliphilus peptidifermentans]SCY49614.1 multisubunit sodium/proton antiporter, MrpD subunit [Alkaliphilus peptidifermentans DSM 18978]